MKKVEGRESREKIHKEMEIKLRAVSDIKLHVLLKIPTYFPNLNMPDTYVCQ